MMHHLLSKIVVLALCGTVAKGIGADTLSDTASAKRYFAKGEELFEEGVYLEAAVAFQQAYDISPNLAVLINIGYCYEYGKEYVKAVTVYRQYLETTSENDPATIEDIQDRLARLQLMVGELHIECRPGECTAEVDGVLKGNTKDGTLVVIMTPGKYSVTVRGKDEQAASGVYRVEAGEKTYARFSFKSTAEVEAPPPVDVSTAAPADTPKGKPQGASGLKPAFFALSGGALAGGVMIAVFGALTLKSKNEYKDSAYRDPEARDAAKRNKLITNISIGVASALAVGAVTVKLLEIRSNKRDKNLDLALTLDASNMIGLQGSF